MWKGDKMFKKKQLLKKESVNMNSITDVLTYCQKREKRVFLIGGSIITILLIALIALLLNLHKVLINSINSIWLLFLRT